MKNHCRGLSINDAGWYQFRKWLEYFGKKFGKVTVAVNPAYTTQSCSSCGTTVKKSLSTRTHICRCGCTLDRDPKAKRLASLTGSQSLMGETTAVAARGAPCTAVAPLGRRPRPHCLTRAHCLPKTALSHHNAAINILNSALSTMGHIGTWLKESNAMARSTRHAPQTGDSSSTVVGEILSRAVES